MIVGTVVRGWCRLSEIVGYEVQVRRESGRWETVGRYSADDQDAARISFERSRLEGGATGIRWIEERVDRQGLFRSRTLGLRSVPPGTPAGRPARRPAPAGPIPGGAERSPPTRPATRPATTGTAGRPAAGTTGRIGGGRPAAPGTNRFSFTEFLGFLFTTVREQVTAVGTAALPPPPGPTGRRGDLAEYADEVDLPTVDLFTSETIVREFHSFVAALDGLDSTEAARANPRYVQGISLFTIGVLFSIEEQIDIFSQRGRTVIHACLGRLVDPVDSINHFVDSLERYLKDEQSAAWIRAGSRCFRHYREAAFGPLNREFGETFGVYDRLEKSVGGRVKVGILFTDIVDSTAMTGTLGDALAQEVIDHHDTTVEAIARKFGGRKVKHLGDGLMLCFGSAQAIAGCAVAIVDTMKGLSGRPEIPGYQIRCGGHFGEAISKADDFFGTTVQLAARVAHAAGPNEARLCAAIIDPGKPAFRRFEDCGAVTLKGFEQPVALARYR